MDEEKKEFAGWWLFLLIILIITSVVLWELGALGKISNTFLERKVFENSLQYSEAKKSEISLYESQLQEIENQINITKDSNTLDHLQAQAASIRIQLNTAKRR